MNGFEQAKRCVFVYTDAGQGYVSWDESVDEIEEMANELRALAEDMYACVIAVCSECWMPDNGHPESCTDDRCGCARMAVRARELGIGGM